MRPETAEQRVSAGAALLDEKGPLRWRQKIRPASLDMYDNCVLDMVMGDWSRGLKELGLARGSGAGGTYGFTPRNSADALELRNTWIEESKRDGRAE